SPKISPKSRAIVANCFVSSVIKHLLSTCASTSSPIHSLRPAYNSLRLLPGSVRFIRLQKPSDNPSAMQEEVWRSPLANRTSNPTTKRNIQSHYDNNTNGRHR